MPIRVRCSCGRLLQARDDWAGRQAKCPQCGSAFKVPAPQVAPQSSLDESDLLDESLMQPLSPSPSQQAAPRADLGGFSDLLDEELARAATPSSSDAAGTLEKKQVRIDVRCVAAVPPEREVVATIEKGVRQHIEKFGEGGFRDIDVQIEVVEWKSGFMETFVGLSLTGWVNGTPIKKRFRAGNSNWYMFGLLGALIMLSGGSGSGGRRFSRQQRRYLDKCLLDLYVALDRASGRPLAKGARLWTTISGVGGAVALGAMVLTIFVTANQGMARTGAVLSGLAVGGLLLGAVLLVRALVTPAEFYQRDVRGRAELARSKVKSAFGLKALLVFGVVLGAAVIVLVVALVSRPLEARRPQAADAQAADSEEEEPPADFDAREDELIRQAEERMAREREQAEQGFGEDWFVSGEPETEAAESTPEEESQPAPPVVPRPFPDMPFPRFGPRDRGPSARMPGTPFGRPVPGQDADWDDAEMAGGSGGMPFQTVSPDGQPVIGFRYWLGQWAGQDAIRILEPLFDRQTRPGPGEPLMARDGYAVGALEVDAGQFVHAVRVVFMRITPDGRLDPDDAYTSDWLGNPVGNTPKTLGGTGEKVIGIRTRRGAVIDAVGLVFEES